MPTRHFLNPLLACLVLAPLFAATPSEAATPEPFGAGIHVGVVELGGSGVLDKSYLLSIGAGARGYGGASLASGALHAFASAEPRERCPTVSYCNGMVSTAYFWDTLTIHNGVNAGLISPWISIDGTLDGTASASVRFYAGGANSNFWSHLDSYAPKQALSSGSTTLNEDAMWVPAYGDTTIFVYASLTARADGGPTWGAVADFGNTLHFNIDLPEGASFTSASGTFMSAVPEPGSAALLLAGSLGLIAWRRRG